MDSAASLKMDPKSIIKAAIEGTGLPLLDVEKYSKGQLERLATLLIEMIRSLILGKLGIPDDVQEALDSLVFCAKKDSKTSSMKPSSDFGRRNSDDPGMGVCTGQTASDCDPAGEPCPGSDTITAGKAGSTSADDAADPCNEETDAEASLRADHHRSRRKPSGRPVGKAKGEKGYGFTIPERVDRQEKTVSLPDACRNCARRHECILKAKSNPSYNEYDIELVVVKKTTVTPVMECPEDGCVKKADPPKDAKGANQYGINIRTLVTLLYTAGMVSLGRIHDIVAPMFGIRLSETTILSYVHILAEKVKHTADAILDAERKQKVVHCDETGCRVGRKMNWIHCVSSELYTFVTLQEKRGKEALDAIGFLTTYVGTVVHDCLSAYWCMDEDNDQLDHAVCNGHIERELAGLSKFFHNASLWADDMLKLLQEMLHTKHQLMEKGFSSISSEALSVFSARYDALIEKGKTLHPVPDKKPGKRGRTKKGRARCLIDRMELRKDDIFRFLTDFDVPYTNNIAEQSFRLLGTRKSVGIFRTISNAKDFCVIWSYLSTARKHGHSYFKAIHDAFEGNSYSLLFPAELSDEQKQQIA